MAVNTGQLQLNGGTSSFVQLEAPAVAGGNTLVLPDGNGTAGQVLSTDGSGILSWTSSVGFTSPLNTLSAGSFDLALGPFWQVQTSFILPNPSNMQVAQSGLIKFNATPTGFASNYELAGCGVITAGTIVGFFVPALGKILLSNPTGSYT